MRGPALFCDTFSSHLWQNRHNYSPFYQIFGRRDSTKRRRCLDYRPRSAFRPSLAQGEGLGHDLRSDGSGKGQAVPPGMAGIVQLRAWAALAASTPNSRARSSLYSVPVPSLWSFSHTLSHPMIQYVDIYEWMSEPFITFSYTWSHRVNYETIFYAIYF